jgi:polyisoprenoid-binding protein YceI
MKFVIGTLVLAAGLAFAAPSYAAPTSYSVDPAHSSIVFTVRHLVTEVEGRFRNFEGSINWDASNPRASTVNFVVKSDSIFTDNDKRDGHLKSPDFFDVAKYPTLEFHSKKVTPRGKDTLEVVGQMTIHGVTKPMMVTVTKLGSAVGPNGEVAGFRTEFSVNRKDYGVIWNKTLDSGSTMLGEDVAVRVLVEAGKKK